MTEREALKLALEALRQIDEAMPFPVAKLAQAAIKEALAQPEPVKIAHKHEWFRTGEMKVGQMRCISCGTWSQEEIPQRTWVGLRDDEIYSVLENLQIMHHRPPTTDSRVIFAQAIEAKLKEKNT